MWSVEWRRLGSHLQIRPIYQPVARPTQLCSSRFRSALCLPTRAQVKGCICQTDRPIVEKRFHERFSFSSAKQPRFGWFAAIIHRPAGPLTETFGVSSMSCRTRGIRASSVSVSHRQRYPWVFFRRDRHITFHAVNQVLALLRRNLYPTSSTLHPSSLS